MLTPREKNFCDIALQCGLISQKQLDEAIQYQNMLSQSVDISTILVEKGSLTRIQANFIEDLVHWKSKYKSIQSKNVLEKFYGFILYIQDFILALSNLKKIKHNILNLEEYYSRHLAELGIKVRENKSILKILEKEMEGEILLDKIHSLDSYIKEPTAFHPSSNSIKKLENLRKKLSSKYDRWLAKLYPLLLQLGDLAIGNLSSKEKCLNDLLLLFEKKLDKEKQKKQEIIKFLLKEEDVSKRGYRWPLYLLLFLIAPVILLSPLFLWKKAFIVYGILGALFFTVFIIFSIINHWKKRKEHILFLRNKLIESKKLIPEIPVFLLTSDDPVSTLKGIHWLTRDYTLQLRLRQILLSGDWLKKNRPSLSPEVYMSLYKHVGEVVPYAPGFPVEELVKREIEYLKPEKVSISKKEIPQEVSANEEEEIPLYPELGEYINCVHCGARVLKTPSNECPKCHYEFIPDITSILPTSEEDETPPQPKHDEYINCAHCGARVLKTPSNKCPKCTYELIPDVTSVIPTSEEYINCAHCGARVLKTPSNECPKCHYEFIPDITSILPTSEEDDIPLYEEESEEYTTCANCGTKVPKTGSNECPKCHYIPEVTTALPTLEDMKGPGVLCPSCGLPIPKGIKICFHCGVKFSTPL